MRGIKLAAPLLVVVALSDIAVATASAAQPEFLSNGGSRTFTGASKKAKLQVKNGATIECTKSKASGSLTSNTTASFTLDCEGVKSLGLSANSLGDASGIVLLNVTAETCFINLSPTLEAGLIITLSPVHIEVPAASQLVVLEGSYVAKLEPINTPTHASGVLTAQKGGVQSIDGCRNASNELDKRTVFTIENEFVDEEGNPIRERSGVEAIENLFTFTEPGHAEEVMA
jgi:hypothetical protein